MSLMTISTEMIVAWDHGVLAVVFSVVLTRHVPQCSLHSISFPPEQLRRPPPATPRGIARPICGLKLVWIHGFGLATSQALKLHVACKHR